MAVALPFCPAKCRRAPTRTLHTVRAPCPPARPPPQTGDLPNVYVYACNNPSESIIAKRRGYGLMISHNVPPYGRAGLYKQLAELRALLQARRGRGRARVLVLGAGAGAGQGGKLWAWREGAVRRRPVQRSCLSCGAGDEGLGPWRATAQPPQPPLEAGGGRSDGPLCQTCACWYCLVLQMVLLVLQEYREDPASNDALRGPIVKVLTEAGGPAGRSRGP